MGVYDFLEFRHLRYIVGIVEAGTFTAAAPRLGIVQSALSRQIRELEDLLHIQIFEPGSSTLTDAGETLYRLALRALPERQEVIDAAQAIHQASLMPFRLGFTQFVDKHVLATVSQAYRDLFPKSSITPENGDMAELLERLGHGDLDAALVTLPLHRNGFTVQQIMHEPLAVCMRKGDPLAQYEEIPPELLNERLAIFSDPRHHPLAHARLLELLAEQGIQPRISSPTFNGEHIQWMVREGLCLALIPKHEQLHEDLVCKPIKGVEWTIDSAIVYRAEHKQTALPVLVRDLERRFSIAIQKKPPQTTRTDRQQDELPFGEEARKRKS